MLLPFSTHSCLNGPNKRFAQCNRKIQISSKLFSGYAHTPSHQNAHKEVHTSRRCGTRGATSLCVMVFCIGDGKMSQEVELSPDYSLSTLLKWFCMDFTTHLLEDTWESAKQWRKLAQDSIGLAKGRMSKIGVVSAKCAAREGRRHPSPEHHSNYSWLSDQWNVWQWIYWAPCPKLLVVTSIS